MKKFFGASLMIKLLVAFAVGGAVLVGSAADSQAGLKLRLSDGSTTITISDNCNTSPSLDCDVDDLSSLNDLIVFAGMVGTFEIVSTTSFGPATQVDPIIADLLSGETSFSGTGGTLTIMMSVTDLEGFDGFKTFLAQIGGNGTFTNTTLSYDVYIDKNNGEFQIAGAGVTQVASISGITSTPFAESESGIAAILDPYSLTLVVTIACSGPCSSSFDASISMPEPATLALFGMGLLMLGAVARRQRKSGPTQGA